MNFLSGAINSDDIQEGIVNFETWHPKIMNNLKNWTLSKEDASILTDFSVKKPVNHLIAMLFLAKFSPDDSDTHPVAVEKIQSYFEYLFDEEKTPFSQSKKIGNISSASNLEPLFNLYRENSPFHTSREVPEDSPSFADASEYVAHIADPEKNPFQPDKKDKRNKKVDDILLFFKDNKKLHKYFLNLVKTLEDKENQSIHDRKSNDGPDNNSPS